MLTFNALTKILDAKAVFCNQEAVIKHLLTDSRNILDPENSIFIAIHGPRYNGHQFSSEVYNKGVRNFLVSEKSTFDNLKKPDANLLLVKDSIEALQIIARYHREQFRLPVLGITGSNGKTIIKEWLTQLLSRDKYVISNPHSYNSQIGVPLSVWRVNEHHNVAIFEAGISTTREMDNLEKIIQPELGMFSNIGNAHDEGFDSRNQKIIEKANLFKHCKRIYYCVDHQEIHEYLSSNFGNISLITWSCEDKGRYNFDYNSTNTDTSIKIRSAHLEKDITIETSFTDKASLENLCHCITFMLDQGYPAEYIREGILQLRSIKMRLELKKGINNTLLIDDTYNNDLAGLETALDFLYHQKQHKERTVIISDLLQTGIDSRVLYEKVAEILRNQGIDKLVGIGPGLTANKDQFPDNSDFFKSTTDFLENFNKVSISNSTILIKGARTFNFEKIVQRLQEKIHGTQLDININALVHNLNFYKSKVRKGTKIMAMVKAFAYGAGSNEVASTLQYHNVDYLGVAYPDEGIHLRKHGVQVPIMVMNPTEEAFQAMIQYDLEPEIYGLGILKHLIDFMKLQPDRSITIHVKLDTGMHRLGFIENEINQLVSMLQGIRNVNIGSIFSHLAGADAKIHSKFTHSQAEYFYLIGNKIEKALSIKPMRHLLNSAGIINYPEYQFDMVRLGIGLYGVEPGSDYQDQLENIATLKAIISQIREVEEGETIGYGRKGVARKPTRVGTISIGYSDGFPRSLSNGKGKVLVNGLLAPVIGDVCMDMTMIDLTDVQAKEGDEVIIFGDELPISQVAEWQGTIPYEVLTNISERVKRVFVYS